LKESLVLKACLDYLHIRGIPCIRNNTGSAIVDDRYVRFGLAGSADIIGCLPDGRFLSIECKSDKGVVSDAQAEWLARIRQNKGLACIVRSPDDLISILKQAGY
jgi:hypothetical protein